MSLFRREPFLDGEPADAAEQKGEERQSLVGRFVQLVRVVREQPVEVGIQGGDRLLLGSWVILGRSSVVLVLFNELSPPK